MTLHDGLKEIGAKAFAGCTLLQGIVVPPTVKSIKVWTFYKCSKLTTVTLHDGLEEIGEHAFFRCTSLQGIVVPPTVKAIKSRAFKKSRLKRVVFCREIEEFVSCKAMRGWWSRGINEKSLRTYGFLRQCNIPERLVLVPLLSWQDNVYEMLRCIPSKSIWSLDAHLDSIDLKISIYEFLIEEGSPMLELAIWKSRSTQSFFQDDDVISNIFSYII